MKKNHSEASGVFPVYAILIYALAVTGRIATLFYERCCSDIALSQWIHFADYLSEILVSGRLSVSIAAAAFAVYDPRVGKWSRYLIHGIAAAFADYLLGCLLHLPLSALSVISQSLNFLMEAAVFCLAVLAAAGMNRKYRVCSTAHERRSYSLNRANPAALAIPLLLHLTVKGLDIFDFVRTYTGITGTEIAHMTGDVLRVLIIYGGLALLIAEGIDALWRKIGKIGESGDD